MKSRSTQRILGIRLTSKLEVSMIALKHEPFITIKGEPFRFYSENSIMSNGKTPYEELTVAKFLLMVLDNFQPSPQLGMVLNMGEIRHLNEASAELEVQSEADCQFTVDQWAVMRKVVDWWIPLMPSGFMRNGPTLVDYLEASG